MVRPRIAIVGGLANAVCVAMSPAPLAQKAALAAGLGTTVALFFVEALALERRALTERWLAGSLLATLVALALGALISGGLESPIVPLMFAPAVVAFAAFGRDPRSVAFLVATIGLLVAIGVGASVSFAPIAAPYRTAMTFVSAATSLVLLAVGVIGLIDGHAAIAAELDRMREGTLREVEERAASIEHLGAHVAHEIKNPLTAVRSLVQLVQRKLEDERDRERLEVVIGEVDRALERIAGYLGFARPIRDLALTEGSASALLDEVALVLEARARDRGVAIEVVRSESKIFGDPQRLRDALLNLALNSIAAGARRITLEARRVDASLELVVVDDGVGMSAETLARVGGAFVSETPGGTGLGVLLVRGIARQHGGELRLESKEGEGTRATIALPAQS